jgi:hypothetical protein
MLGADAKEVPMKTRIVTMLSCVTLLGLGCRGHESTGPSGTNTPGQTGVRVVNAYAQPVDVIVDGAVAVSGVQPGHVDTALASVGSHAVALRAAGTTTPGLQMRTGSVQTVVALRFGASLAADTIGDTNAIVPPGATKVRVLHLAPNAGEIQVFRTQPDWSTPMEWQFPFLYDSVTINDPMAHPFLQSTVGTWDIRAWRKPSEVGLGWDGTTARVTFDLKSGEKRTVMVLDKPGGGIELSVID